ncbi:MAG: hypothetical protein AAF726_22565 [Planctomycetota bacterium]
MPSAFHQVLLILLGTLFLGGSGEQDRLRERVESVLPEGPRRDRAVAITDELDGMVDEAVRGFILFHHDFYRSVEADPESESKRRLLLDAQLEKTRALDQRTLDRYMELRTVVDSAEWAEVYAD